MLHLIGVGLGSLEDVSVRGWRQLEQCSKIYLEMYTSVQPGLRRALLEEKFPQAEVFEADRRLVESDAQCDLMLEAARKGEVAFLVVGDVFGATTHADLFLRAKSKGVEISVYHNASILNAVGCTGLQLYRFGETVSVPFFEPRWRPSSFMDRIAGNLARDLHTLVLLDIKVKEQTLENLLKENDIFEPPRFMTVNVAIEQILSLTPPEPEALDYAADETKEGAKGVTLPSAVEKWGVDASTKAFGVARVGQPDQLIVSGTLAELQKVDFGRELHSLAICAPKLHEIEEMFFDMYHVSRR